MGRDPEELFNEAIRNLARALTARFREASERLEALERGRPRERSERETDLERALGQRTHELGEAEREVRLLRDQLAEAERRAEDLEGALDAANSELDDLRGALEEASSALAASDASLAERIEEVLELRDRVDDGSAAPRRYAVAWTPTATTASDEPEVVLEEVDSLEAANRRFESLAGAAEVAVVEVLRTRRRS